MKKVTKKVKQVTNQVKRVRNEVSGKIKEFVFDKFKIVEKDFEIFISKVVEDLKYFQSQLNLLKNLLIGFGFVFGISIGTAVAIFFNFNSLVRLNQQNIVEIQNAQIESEKRFVNQVEVLEKKISILSIKINKLQKKIKK